MKKIFALMITVVLVLGLLVACQGAQEAPGGEAGATENGAEGGDGAGEVAADEVGTIELNFWTDFPPRSEYILREAAAAFMLEFPQYTIEIDIFPGADRAERLALAQSTNTLPTLMFAASFVMMDFAHQGAMVPMTEVIEPLASYFPAHSIADTTINGEHFFFPLYQSPFVLMYNADMFREAGLDEFITDTNLELAEWTLDEFVNVILPGLRDLVAGTARYPFALFAGNEQADPHNHNLLRMYGGTVFDGGLIVAHEDENTIRALDTLASWVEQGFTNSDAATKLGTEAQSDFSNQMSGISFGQLPVFQQWLEDVEAGEMEAFDFRMAMVPREGGHTMTVNYLGGFLMNTDDAQKEGGRKFLTWLADQQDTFLKELNLLAMPTHSGVLAAIGDNPLYPLYQEFAARGDAVFDVTGGAPGYVETRALFFPAIQSVISGELTSREALERYAIAGNEIIEEYIRRSVVLN